MIRPRSRGRLSYVVAAVGVSIALAFTGCSRPPALSFDSSEKIQSEEFSELHRKQIESSLKRYFGTPANPKLMVPDEEAEEVEEVAEDTGDEGETAEPETKLVSAMDATRLKRGGAIYNVRCAGCHGITGDGKGEAAPYLHPKPRDYRRGIYKFTSTPFGAKPARNDLLRTIRRGAKGTSMPAFPWMPKDDVEAVIDYVIMLSQRGELEEQVAQIAEFDYDADEELDPIEFSDTLVTIRDTWALAESQVVHPETKRPPYNRESILKGREIFIADNCWKCHGKDGKGQTEWLSVEFIEQQEAAPEGEAVVINRDAWGEVAPAADITARMLHGGRRPIDVYRRIHTGINGTPMPAFGQAFAEDPDKTWHLVHYVLSIVEGGSADPAADDPAESEDESDAAAE